DDTDAGHAENDAPENAGGVRVRRDAACGATGGGGEAAGPTTRQSGPSEEGCRERRQSAEGEPQGTDVRQGARGNRRTDEEVLAGAETAPAGICGCARHAGDTCDFPACATPEAVSGRPQGRVRADEALLGGAAPAKPVAP